MKALLKSRTFLIFFGIIIGVLLIVAFLSYEVLQFKKKLGDKEKEIKTLVEENAKLSEDFISADNDRKVLLNELDSCHEDCLTVDACSSIVKPLVLRVKAHGIKEIKRIYDKVQILDLWGNDVEQETAFDLYLKSSEYRTAITITQANGHFINFNSTYFGTCSFRRQNKLECLIKVKDLNEEGKKFLKKEAFK